MASQLADVLLFAVPLTSLLWVLISWLYFEREVAVQRQFIDRLSTQSERDAAIREVIAAVNRRLSARRFPRRGETLAPRTSLLS